MNALIKSVNEIPIKVESSEITQPDFKTYASKTLETIGLFKLDPGTTLAETFKILYEKGRSLENRNVTAQVDASYQAGYNDGFEEGFEVGYWGDGRFEDEDSK